MDKATASQQLNNRFKASMELISPESNRGAVIVGAAVLDDIIREALAARLVPSLERDDELLDGSNAPCGTFSARIDLAYRIGVVTAPMRSSLHILRKMRNDAAHVGEQRDFTSPPFRSRLLELLRLNRGFLQILWNTVEAGGDGRNGPAPTSNDELADFVNKVGQRSAWNILISMIAAALSLLPDVQGQLEPIRDGTKGSADASPPAGSRPAK